MNTLPHKNFQLKRHLLMGVWGMGYGGMGVWNTHRMRPCCEGLAPDRHREWHPILGHISCLCRTSHVVCCVLCVVCCEREISDLDGLLQHSPR